MMAMSDEPNQDPQQEPVVQRVVSAIDDAVQSAVGAIGGVADAARDATTKGLQMRPGARVRAVRRLGHQPLPMLYEDHPEARRATPHEVGLRTIDVADVAGTAVGGARQRGGDFLPLKPFRSDNWKGRWQRLRSAADRLVILPPIDVVRFGDRYWVLDGHNRVASALYGGQLVDRCERHRPSPSRRVRLRAAIVARRASRRPSRPSLRADEDLAPARGRPAG